MSGLDALGGARAIDGAAQVVTGTERVNALPHRAGAVDFGSLLAQGVGSVDAKVAHADAMVAQFAIDDSVPVHQVTIALEEARLSVEFAMQVRARLVEGYKELMNMQL